MKNKDNSERISKVIARSSQYSRRQVEQLIVEGRVRIDGKIRETINQIKLEEAKIASKENAIADSAPQVSVAT